MLQYYSGHGSQYWASSGFLGLALPPAHPVWTETEEPMAVERGDYCVAMAEPGFLVRGTRADGIVRVASHRSDHYPLPLPRRLKLEHAGARLIQALKGAAPRRPAPVRTTRTTGSSPTRPTRRRSSASGATSATSTRRSRCCWSPAAPRGG